MTDLLQLELLPCGYVVLAEDGQVMEANGAFLDMLGLPDSPETQLNFNQLLTFPSRVYYSAQIAAALKLQPLIQEVALDLLHTSGSRVPVLVNARFVPSSSSEESALIHMAVFSAAGRRRYENELMEARKHAERVAEVVHRSPDAIVLVSPAGIIESWNHGAERVFGHAQADALKRSFIDLLFPAGLKSHTRESVLEVANGNVIEIETIALHRQGHEIAVSVHLNPHIDPPGLLTAYSAVIRDITSRKLSERALIQNEKLASVGRLASSIAHEINNPLESVTNLLYILNFQTEDVGMKGTIQTAQEELARISEIAKHTLRFHRQTSGQSHVDVPAMIDSILLLYKAKMHERAVTAEVQRSDATPLFCYDGELRQVLSNLIGNALDALQPKGRIVIRCRDTNLESSKIRSTRITIADTGSGIAAEHLARIFEPFFTTKGIAGSGLGLWITQELVTKNRGTIQVRSSTRPSHSGTVFVLQFPNGQLGEASDARSR